VYAGERPKRIRQLEKKREGERRGPVSDKLTNGAYVYTGWKKHQSINGRRTEESNKRSEGGGENKQRIRKLDF